MPETVTPGALLYTLLLPDLGIQRAQVSSEHTAVSDRRWEKGIGRGSSAPARSGTVSKDPEVDSSTSLYDARSWREPLRVAYCPSDNYSFLQGLRSSEFCVLSFP